MTRHKGAVKGAKPHRGKRVTLAEFSRLWHDPRMTVADIARALDISERSVWSRAHHRGMPDRTQIAAMGKCGFGAEFEAMWFARVIAADIGAHYGRHEDSVSKHARRHGFQRSAPITRWAPGITLAEYRLREMATRMAAAARVEQAAFRCAEMIEARPGGQPKAGRAA